MTPAQIKKLAKQTAKVCAGDTRDQRATEAHVAEFLRANEEQREAMQRRANGRMIEFDCVTAGDFDICSGCAHHGPQGCLKQQLTDLDHAACEAEGRRSADARGKQPCHDCAFRRGSPEHRAELTDRLARQSTPFRCHQGAPLDGKGREPSVLAFWPRDESLYPVCAGWAAARADLRLRQQLARAVAHMQWRLNGASKPTLVDTRHQRTPRAIGGMTQRQRVIKGLRARTFGGPR